MDDSQSPFSEATLCLSPSFDSQYVLGYLGHGSTTASGGHVVIIIDCILQISCLKQQRWKRPTWGPGQRPWLYLTNLPDCLCFDPFNSRVLRWTLASPWTFNTIFRFVSSLQDVFRYKLMRYTFNRWRKSPMAPSVACLTSGWQSCWSKWLLTERRVTWRLLKLGPKC